MKLLKRIHKGIDPRNTKTVKKGMCGKLKYVPFAEDPAKVHGARDGRRHAAICSALLEKRLLSATLGTLSHSVQSYTRSASTSGAAGAGAAASSSDA